MIGYLARRAATALALVFLVLTVLFFLVRLAPGRPAAFYDNQLATADEQENLRRAFGLDQPIPIQYLHWLESTVTGNWGVSFSKHRPVIHVLAESLPQTLLLATTALFLQYLLGLVLGITSARRLGSLGDHLIRLLSLIVYSIPSFWLGLMALLLLSYRLPFFPGGGMNSVGAATMSPWGYALDLAHHLALPAGVLGIAAAAGVARHVRNDLADVLQEDYIRTARAKGVSEHAVVWVHGLKNAAASLTQLAGLALPFLLSGALVIEVVFSWPGMGRLTFDAITARDYPLILGATTLTALLVVGGSFLADVLLAVVDPRVRDA